MGSDNSRFSFKPERDYFGVVMQQGRVQLDSDWNEWLAELDRRIRAGTLDTIGRAVVPAETPDAFRITISADKILIGRGRIYVDGVLAENHGRFPVGWDSQLAQQQAAPKLAWDPHLAELYATEDVDYANQPYYPLDPSAAGLPTSGTSLVYLDVWQREVTFLEAPDIVEQAIGVDTTARLQTVWQVKLLDGVGGISCATPDDKIPNWVDTISPSAGRLTTGTADVPGQSNPCLVPASGGYKGLENQLYRVEIHKGGKAPKPGDDPATKPTFKWSRDNASVATAVADIPDLSHLIVESVGKDGVLRFSNGDWIELIDDWLELNGQPGEICRIAALDGVDDATRTITLAAALKTFPLGTPDPARHTRIRRWDQKGKILKSDGSTYVDLDADGSGLIPVPPAGTSLLLENGIVVSFDLDPAGGEFKPGDYWAFAARTTQPWVEPLDNAPPRGIHHHYARLAVVTFPSEVHDCRVPWPPDCGGCCTVVVAPGESIQAALDSLPKQGGCVCLKTGVHEIGMAIELAASRIVLKGEGPGTIVRSSANALLKIVPHKTPVSDVVIEAIRFETTSAKGVAGESIVQAVGCSRLLVKHCELVATAGKPAAHGGASLSRVSDASFIRNRLQGLDYGVVAENCEGRLEIRHNDIRGVPADSSGAGGSAGTSGVSVSAGGSAPCRIESNRIQDFVSGIVLAAGADGTVVSGNLITRRAFVVKEPVPLGTDALRGYLDKRLYAIDVEASNCEVRGNQIDLPSAAFGGIRAGAGYSTIVDNALEAQPVDATPTETGAPSSAGTGTGLAPLPASIYLGPGDQGSAANHATVRNNRLSGPQTGIVASRVDDVTVIANHVDGGAWYGALIDDCREARVLDNDIRLTAFGVFLVDGQGNRVIRNQIRQCLLGIGALREDDLESSANTLADCVAGGIALLWAGRATSLAHNRIVNCAYAGPLSFGMLVVGAELLAPSGAMLSVADCAVIDSGISSDGKTVSGNPVIAIGAWVPACQLTANDVGYTQLKLKAELQHRALLLIGPITFNLGKERYTFGSALVNGNHFRGPGRTALVEFRSLSVLKFEFEKAKFVNNVCVHWGATAGAQTASVQFLAGELIVMGNDVKSSQEAAPLQAVNSMSLGGGKKAIVGNITNGKCVFQGTVTPSPIESFNLVP